MGHSVGSSSGAAMPAVEMHDFETIDQMVSVLRDQGWEQQRIQAHLVAFASSGEEAVRVMERVTHALNQMEDVCTRP